MMKKIWDWLVTSSIDPTKTSLTVKAGLTTVAGILITISPLLNLKIGSEQVTATVDSVSQITLFLLTAISAMMTVFGLVRKIANTWKS